MIIRNVTEEDQNAILLLRAFKQSSSVSCRWLDWAWEYGTPITLKCVDDEYLVTKLFGKLYG